MQLLCDRIQKDGELREGGIVKVDSFLNHQLDPALLDSLGREFARLFGGDGVNKILTVESSGIAIAVFAGLHLGVPVVFAKKNRSKNIDADVYTAPVHSYTHGTDNLICVSKSYLHPEDNVLIIDDFLAVGNAVKGMMKLVADAGAKTAGVGVAVEKSFQDGGKDLRAQGVKLRSLAIVDIDANGSITLRNDVD